MLRRWEVTKACRRAVRRRQRQLPLPRLPARIDPLGTGRPRPACEAFFTRNEKAARIAPLGFSMRLGERDQRANSGLLSRAIKRSRREPCCAALPSSTFGGVSRRPSAKQALK